MDEKFNAAFVAVVGFLTQARAAQRLHDGGASQADVKNTLRGYFIEAMIAAEVPPLDQYLQECREWIETEIGMVRTKVAGVW